MGFSTLQWRSKHKMMKFRLFTCLAAAALAEPEPLRVYRGYGGYATGYPATYGYGLGVSHYGYPYSTYSQGFYGKREAEAEPEAKADPQYLTRYTTPHAAFSNYGYGFPSTYGYGFPSTYGYSRYGYGKREAEAEPEADPQYLSTYTAGYTAPAYNNYGYGLHNYGYRFPSTYGYSRYGYGKREAEAEPYLYGSYARGYYPRTYANYGYGYPAYTTYGYGYHG